MKKIILSTLLATILMAEGSGATEVADKGASIKQVNAVSLKNAKSNAESKQTKLAVEAIASLRDAHEALVALDKSDKKTAMEKIANALGKLETILAAENAPKLLPVDSVVSVNEFIGSSEEIDVVVKHAKALLDQDKIQEARVLLAPLISELDITVISLPLASYPDALKLAAKYLDGGEMEKAKKILSVALSTFTKVTEIVPLPLLKATDLIVAASSIATEDKEKALLYLKAASENLKVARKLGYISQSTTTYKALQEQIQSVQKEVEGSNQAESLFKRLEESLKEFKEKIFNKK